MTNTEKHQKIYELTGVEPRMWSGKSSGGDLVISDYYNVYDEHRIDLPNPYYPAEQLWELLPEIKDYCLRMNKAIIYYEHWADSRHEVPDLIEFSIVNGNLLTALLDMVLWCIENGYIKKRGEE